MVNYWSVPYIWHGATIVCIGGGPSLTAEQVEYCRGKARVIAINDAYKLAPWADVLYFCDDKWWMWHHKKLVEWQGMIVRLQGGKHDFGDQRIKVLRNLDQRDGLSDRQDGLHTGQNSGFQAINLAALFGAARILLLGYDMQVRMVGGLPKSHWFGDHPGGTSPRVYEQMVRHFPSLIEPLKKKGISIANCTPGSKLTCFPMSSIEQALPEERAAA